ncbi:MAG: thioesterase family protein [Burkholderiales bacterium]|nr:thioesterase family protein [Burkholderiales bacterium]
MKPRSRGWGAGSVEGLTTRFCAHPQNWGHPPTHEDRLTTPIHPFDAAIALTPRADGVFEGATHADYGNMVGPFGGITASAMLNAAMLHPRRLGEPLALTVNFAGPIADGAFCIHARPVRTNRSTQHWQIELDQGGVVQTTASAVFGTRRDTWADTELGMPVVPPAEAIAPTLPPPRVAWAQRYEMRFIAAPWVHLGQAQAAADSQTRLWIRDEPPRPLDALSLAAIADNFYPRIFRRRARFTPAGTVSITTYFHADAAALAAQGTRPVLGVAQGLRYGGGYFDQSAQIWGDGGLLLASSHQLVYFKD